jgi:hypothetical protein
MDNINLGGIGNTGGSQGVNPLKRSGPKEVQSTAPQGDTVEISSEGAYVSSLVADVAQMSPMRPEVVQQVQEKVRGGNYPPPALVDGLARLMGNQLSEAEAS